jgi:trimethylamine-N-oxide reductase cytochrome c-type subunit TorC
LTTINRALLGGALVLGLLIGLGTWGGYEAATAFVTTNAFCTSCHEMQTVADEYQHKIHYSNPAGVRAQCADCHVPKPFVARVVHMIGATRDLVGHVTGVIDTPAKFEAHRPDMARRVWAEMTANGSLGCRSCHAFEAMDFAHQTAKASLAMHVTMPAGTSCISCHKGIAHHLPPVTAASFAEAMATMSAATSATAGSVLTSTTGKKLFLTSDAATSNAAASDATAGGTLLPGSTVTVTAVRGTTLQISLAGWQQNQVPRAVYALRGQRILTAALTPAAIAQLQLGPDATDPDTAIVWRKVTLVAWIAADGMVAGQQALWDGVADIYAAACGSCHGLSPPAAYTANQWIGTANAMRQSVALDDDQYRLLVKYLQLNARDTAPANQDR